MDKSVFDEILRENVKDALGLDLFGYLCGNLYPNHYNNCSFANFTLQMMNNYPKHYEKYNLGKGSELKPQGTKPPKMASVASSSRFCYLALRNGAMALGGSGDVDFEHSCPVFGIRGTPPQMDAYIKNENIFVEVKCHEIFDFHKIKLSSQYYDLLFGDSSDFDFHYKPADAKKEFEIPRSEFGLKKDQTMVDVKQLICHLLGIKFHKKDVPATLVYLFFRPKAQTEKQRKELDDVFNDLKTELETIFKSVPIKSFVTKNDIKLSAIVQYSEVMSPLTVENMIQLFP